MLGSLFLGVGGTAAAVTVAVKGPAGEAVSGFRYTIEEDATMDVVPDQTGLNGDPTLSLGFHKSHMKVVKVGHAPGSSVNWAEGTGPNQRNAAKRYFITVMPDNVEFGSAVPTGYTMNGTPIRPGVSNVVVPVNKLPFKTAQISVFVFEDNGPINGAPDAPGEQEQALCGFELQLFEAGGTYGASGGRVATDTFGNLLGTEYEFNGSNPVYNPDGSLKVAKQGSMLIYSDRNGVARVKNLSPAKYTIFTVAPREMPSVTRCNFADAPNVPIWVRNEAARTRPDQLVWDNQYEIAKSHLAADQSKWHQTTTIEGTWGVDAWVKSGEPTFFKEFGPPGHHVWHGWVRRFKDTNPTTGLVGDTSVTGIVKSTHMSRPPGIRFHSGKPMSSCWVGLNTMTLGVGLGQALYANACNEDGSFKIDNLIAGQRYQLAVWDEPLDNVIANYEFTAPTAGATLDLKDVPVFSWFANLQGTVFYDQDSSGYPFAANNVAKPGIPGSVVNIRFRDGSIYNSTVTDDEGHFEFPELFPFFNWMVAETDFTRFKATGATIIPDNGGEVKSPSDLGYPSGLWPDKTMTPQLQPDNGNEPYRIFGGANDPSAPSSANLLQTFQAFLGQTNVIHWGKKEYNPADVNDHGGITGVVHYASTRSEFDPKFATAENNEPGIPSVEIRLYKLNAQNQVVSPTRGVIPASAANQQDAIQVVVSDDWNKAEPDDCVDPVPYTDRTGVNFGAGKDAGKSKCSDGMRIWNQVRDGVFDGGWAFTDYCPGGVTVNRDANGDYVDTTCNAPAQQPALIDPQPLPPGRYMTEGVAPYGYEHQKEEDKNVDFGDLLSPGTLANPSECLGSRSEGITYDDNGNPVAIPLLVPAELEAFAGVAIPERFRGANRPYCNKKLVVVAPGANPFSDFHMFAKAPIAGHIVGMILDDLANEFDPYSPSFGEKYAPPFMPISIRDYAGNEINRVYSDRYGTYNAMVPSTFAYNVPLPSGVAPNMVNVCLNSPTMKDPVTGATVIDPHYNPQYTQYCYTFQYLPGKTTYLDTPVLPLAAFSGGAQHALDCEQPDVTPAIKMVTGSISGSDVGPWADSNTGGEIKIVSMGMTQVSNPAYDQSNLGTPGAGVPPKNVTRNFGFGSTMGKVFVGGTEVIVGSWQDDVITAYVMPGQTGNVEVVAANGKRTPRGVTLHGGPAPITVGQGGGYAHATIQAAIDAAPEGALITVAPGVYEEAPILWKRVRVQGYGAPVTIVNAAMGADYLREQAWREKVCNLVLVQGMSSALLPGQTLPADMNACLTGDTVDNAPLLFAEEGGSGFFVLEKPVAGGLVDMAKKSLPGLQIDGFTITGADTGGAIVANGNAVQLQVSNNRITGNQGLYNGGIRIGHADLADADLPVDANNLFVNIHHNEILKNGNLAGETAGGGGGISMYTGSHGYRVAQNYVCGNFSTGDGGGMAHFGKSDTLAFTAAVADDPTLIETDNLTKNGTAYSYAASITDNQFRFNQSFSQAKSVQGGGLAVVGIIDPGPDNGVTLGTGNLTIANNVFQGNLAGAGDGGGIALVGTNGTADVGTNAASWNRVTIINNLIANNAAGVAGGGISMQDAARVDIVNNTISMNDSYAVAARAFQGGTGLTDAANLGMISTSVVQDGAGVTAYGHSPGLLAHLASLGLDANASGRWFSDATIVNSVVLGNRSYNWAIDYTRTQSDCSYAVGNGSPCFGLVGPASQTRVGNDIAVLFAPAAAPRKNLLPVYSVFTAQSATDGTLGNSNLTGVFNDFASSYFNGSNGSLKQLIWSLEQSVVLGAPVLEVQEPTTATTAAAFDEGGNFVDVRFGPLTRGACNPMANWDNLTCANPWTDFGTYKPATPALNGHFAMGDANAGTVWPKAAKDINGIDRSPTNWVRGALAQ
jgi:hypothetical protein